MAVVQPHGSTWSVRWRENGKQRRAMFATEAEAEAARLILKGREKRAQRSASFENLVRDEIARLEAELARLRRLLVAED